MTDQDEDTPIFEPFQTETLDDGPSWGCILFLGIGGIALCVIILVLANA